MKDSVRRGVIAIAAVGAVVGCTSDINYRAYLPFALAEGSQSMFRTREFGECSVEAFRISDSLGSRRNIFFRVSNSCDFLPIR